MPLVAKEKSKPLVRIDYAHKSVLDQLTAKTGESAPRLLHRAVTALKMSSAPPASRLRHYAYIRAAVVRNSFLCMRYAASASVPESQEHVCK